MELVVWVMLMADPTPPAAARAAQLAKAQQWEELYLAFATASPKGYSKHDQPVVAKALVEGCHALSADDAVMAYSLGERSVAFTPTAEGLFCTGLTGLAAEQRAAAEESFRAGLTKFPKDYRFPLELGRLLAEEGDVSGARTALLKIPKKAKQWADAEATLRRLSKGAGEEPPPGAGMRPEAEAQLRTPAGAGGSGESSQPPPPSTESSSYESSVDEEGRRVRANQYFRFRYFNAQRDFGQRADYEGTVQAALEDARRAAERLVGVARKAPTDVILYSRKEFEMHHGAQAASAVAGFYSGSAIRMNDSAEMNAHNQATLVHEYVHAVVDELSGFHDERLPVWLNEGLAEYTEWQYEGHDGPPGRLGVALKQQALSKSLPPISSMSHGPLIGMSNPALAYALSASAVKVLVAKRGMREVVGLIEDTGKGLPFAEAYRQRYGLTLEELDGELASELIR